MPTSKERPDIVFIVLDTHRLDRLGCYGYHRNTSPNIDAFAQNATVFERAISPAQWTIPSHASLFTGEPVTTHMTIHSGDVLDPRHKTLAELLSARGYRTVGVCNNPLVGVIQNGFRRGFQEFYSYSGAVRSVPKSAERLPQVVQTAWAKYRKGMRRITDPIQNLFATSTQVFLAALNPMWVPLWTRFAHFKGDTPRSIRDTVQLVKGQMQGQTRDPAFLFVNLMEPHLPYSPPDRFVDSFAPRLREDRAARDFIHRFNMQAMQWLVPLERPFSPSEAQALSDMYDAEVAYQDHLLSELLEMLSSPERRENTMVVLVADHGEMLGEHQLMGHGFGVYQELIQVPLIMRLPGQEQYGRVSQLVSARRLFHTVLEAAGEESFETASGLQVDLHDQSLSREPDLGTVDDRVVWSEAYAPGFALRILEKHRPSLISELHCRSTNWALYENEYKLMRIEGVEDRLYSLADDPREETVFSTNGVTTQRRMALYLDSLLEGAMSRRLSEDGREKVDLEDEAVRQQLRGLGYIE